MHNNFFPNPKKLISWDIWTGPIIRPDSWNGGIIRTVTPVIYLLSLRVRIFKLLPRNSELVSGNQKAKHEDKIFSSVKVVVNSTSGNIPDGPSNLTSKKAHGK